MQLIEVPHGSELYRQAVALRHRLLREPLGLQFSEAQLAAETAERHWVALIQDRVVGSVTLQHGAPPRLRQMVVDEPHQHRGIGRELVAIAESAARDAGATALELHAREVVTGFYLRCGYHIVSEPYLEVGIPHVTMEKRF